MKQSNDNMTLGLDLFPQGNVQRFPKLVETGSFKSDYCLKVKKEKDYSSRIGRAGELRVASELLLRKHHPLLSLIDFGIDIMLENGKRIQVKTSTKHLAKIHTEKGPKIIPVYNFTFINKRRKTSEFNNIDFMILWAIDDDLFFIIPVEKVRGTWSITLRSDPKVIFKKRDTFRNFLNRWDLLE